MKYTEFHFTPEHLDAKMAEYVKALGGRDPLETFVAQTAKVIARKGEYLRFGPYWFAVKRIMNTRSGKFYGEATSWLADEYTEKNPNGTAAEARTLVAAWEFAEDLTSSGMPYPREYDFAEHTYLVEDDDM